MIIYWATGGTFFSRKNVLGLSLLYRIRVFRTCVTAKHPAKGRLQRLFDVNLDKFLEIKARGDLTAKRTSLQCKFYKRPKVPGKVKVWGSTECSSLI